MTLTVAEPVELTSLTVADPVTLPVLTVNPEGQRVWVGEGVPTLVQGSQFGDHYLDEATGQLYRLD